MNDIQLLERLNKATKNDLMSLKGIGTVLAGRLIAARPFESLDEVAVVIKGFKPSLFTNWAENSVPLVEPEPTSISGANALFEKPTTFEDNKKRKQASHSGGQRTSPKQVALWDQIPGHLLASLAAIILTLAILGGINGGLDFATGVEYKSMAQEASHISGDVATLQEDITGLRSRVDTLDGLTDRTMGIEEEQAELAEALNTVTEELTAAQTELDTLEENLSQQDERTLRFEGFLENLQQTLNELFPQEGDE